MTFLTPSFVCPHKEGLPYFYLRITGFVYFLFCFRGKGRTRNWAQSPIHARQGSTIEEYSPVLKITLKISTVRQHISFLNDNSEPYNSTIYFSIIKYVFNTTTHPALILGHLRSLSIQWLDLFFYSEEQYQNKLSKIVQVSLVPR